MIDYNDGDPIITMSVFGRKYVSVNCASPVTLNMSSATDFYIVVPPTVSTDDITVEIGTDQGVMTKSIPYNERNKIERNKIINMPEVTASSADFEVVTYPGKITNQSIPTFISGAWWAPVNCGYNGGLFKYGKLYQWGRVDGQFYWKSGDPNNDYNQDVETNEAILDYGPISTPPLADKFYMYTGSPWDWITPQNDNLWNSNWTTDRDANPAKTFYDPCPANWRVPTSSELNAIAFGGTTSVSVENPGMSPGGQKGRWFGVNHATATTANPQCCIFLPFAGRRGPTSGGCVERGANGSYWSSSPNLTEANHLKITGGQWSVYNEIRSYGFSVRCVKE